MIIKHTDIRGIVDLVRHSSKQMNYQEFDKEEDDRLNEKIIQLVRDYLESINVPIQQERKAHVQIINPDLWSDEFKVIKDYMPSNYTVELASPEYFLIRGYDNAGWTLDGYVIPRLQSGLIAATEVT